MAGVSHVRGWNGSSEMVSAPGPPLTGTPGTRRDAEKLQDRNHSLVQ